MIELLLAHTQRAVTILLPERIESIRADHAPDNYVLTMCSGDRIRILWNGTMDELLARIKKPEPLLDHSDAQGNDKR